MQMIEYKKITPIILLVAVLLSVAVTVLFAAHYIEQSQTAQTLISKLGYVGVVIIAIIAGLNVAFPIPAATLTPLFTAAGLWLPMIILALTIGTFIADLTGYLFGSIARTHIYKHYPRIVAYLEKIYTDRPHLIIPVVFLYVAFIPLPNEVLVIPLALLHIRLRLILLPLFLGNLMNQTIYALGMQGIFSWLF